MNQEDFDLVVIGGGPGGYVAAIRAAQLGMRTALIEREHLGGICSNWGCIPTKALLHTASLYRHMRDASQLGLNISGLTVDFPKMIAASRNVAGQMNAGVRHLLRKNKVTLFEGEACLQGHGKVSVASMQGDPMLLGATHIIIATGARPRALENAGFDGQRVWSYRDALQAATLPQSLLIVGAGAIGVEFASFFATFGTQVTLVEARDRILPVEDAEISAFVHAAFEKQGIAVQCATRLGQVNSQPDALEVALERAGNSSRVSVERMLVSVGITGNTENIGLDNTEVIVDNGHIVTDDWGRTAQPGIYAIGDVAGAPWLAHKASHEAVHCVEGIAGGHRQGRSHQRFIPGCTYSYPQVASIGMTEAQARAAGHECRVGRFPFIGNGKARAQGETDGFVKTIFDSASGELLGAHLVGAEVTEMIHGLTMAKQMEATEAEIMETVFAHPTLAEAVHESVLMAYGRALHI